MKPREIYLFRWIVIAALADWLITRSLARMAIFMPKSPFILAFYQGLIAAGQFASLLCAILGLFGLGWLAWRLRNHLRGGLSFALLCLVFLSLFFIFQTPEGWLLLAARVLISGIIVWFGIHVWQHRDRLDHKLALMIPVLAVWTGLLYHSLQAFYAVLRLPGPPAHATTLFNIGELLAVLSPIGLWWVYGRQPLGRRSIAIYLIALLPGILYLAAHRLNPSMTGILAVWSTGLTLYLPPLLYAASLWLGTTTILVASRQGNRGGTALLLLVAAGYAPQLSTQIFLALIGLSVLADHWHGEGNPAPPAFRAEKLEATPRYMNG
jgi:hypothetical protein